MDTDTMLDHSILYYDILIDEDPKTHKKKYTIVLSPKYLKKIIELSKDFHPLSDDSFFKVILDDYGRNFTDIVNSVHAKNIPREDYGKVFKDLSLIDQY